MPRIVNCETEPTAFQLLISKMEFLEQFADSVLDYTSKYNNLNSISYAPVNLTGKPTQYPQYGDFPDTYMLRSYGKWWLQSEGAQPSYMPQDVDAINSEDYIILKFETAVVPCNVILYETYNPGAVVRLYGRLSGGQWHLLYEAPPQRCPASVRKFAPTLNDVRDIVNEIRIEFNQSKLKYHTSLDAVLLCGHRPKTDLQLYMLRKGLLDTPVARSRMVLRSHVAAGDGVDLFTTLPYEVMVHIFQYLDLQSLARCAQVNQRWHEASLDSTIYQCLSLKKYWVKVDNTTLKFFMRRCRTLRKLDLSWCGNNQHITEDIFQNFLKTCGQQLTHLSVCNCDFVKNVAINEISKCTELTDLRLRNVFPCAWTFSFIGNLTKLVALDLYSTAVTDDYLIKILKSNRHLKHLIIDFCENLERLDEIAETISLNNQRLVTLSCWKTKSFTSEGVKHLGRCSHLRELDLGWCFILTEPGDCLEWIAQGCKDLRRLILSNWRGLSDHLLLPILRSCKHLSQLDLLGIRNLTGDICERALASLPKLRLLEVGFCDNVTEDKVRRWRELYPRVTIQRSCS